MGNKKKKYLAITEEPVPLIPPYDDPYWVLADNYIEASKSNRNFDQFNRLKRKYPEWADDLMTCYPTYYGILGVLRGESAETLKEHYELETNFSVYPDSTIDEAYGVLSDTLRRVKYDEFLTLFLK